MINKGANDYKNFISLQDVLMSEETTSGVAPAVNDGNCHDNNSSVPLVSTVLDNDSSAPFVRTVHDDISTVPLISTIDEISDHCETDFTATNVSTDAPILTHDDPSDAPLPDPIESDEKETYNARHIRNAIKYRQEKWTIDFLGKDGAKNYKFGDISKKVMCKLAGKEQNYQFGDISKNLLKQIGTKRK
jgi:hypothetical protein